MTHFRPHLRPLLAILLALVAQLPMSCDNGYRLLDAEPQIVVEGWIRNGEFPVVFVTTTVPLTQESQSLDSLGRYVLTWARVTISDGDETVILTGRVNSKYFLPDYFTTSWMRGQAGKTYTIDVSYRHYHATATTTIPPQPARVDSFSVAPVAGQDSALTIRAHVSPQPGGTGYYKFLVAEQGTDRDYLSSYLGVYSDLNIGSGAALPVYRPHRLKEKHFRANFLPGDTVHILFAAIDSAAYAYWDAYERSVSFSSNPLFPSNVNLPGNISGGLGYWHGYCGTEYTVVAGKNVRSTD